MINLVFTTKNLEKLAFLIVLILVFVSIGFYVVEYSHPRTATAPQTSINSSKSVIAPKINLLFDKLELAITPQDRKIGLMNRQELCENCAMLFVFENSELRSFWMKKTLIPLDIVFIDETGKILNIERGEPLTETPTVDSKGQVKYVLEMSVNNPYTIKENDILDIPKLLASGVKITN